MTAFDKAVTLRTDAKSREWEIGALLLEATRSEGRTIREYALTVDRTYDSEDKYTNWKSAAEFREVGIPDALNVLPISYFADAMTALRDGLDYEDIIERLVKCAYDDRGRLRDKFQGVRVFQAWRQLATGKGKPLEKVERDLVRVIENSLPMWTGQKDAMGIGAAFRAQMIVKCAAALLFWLKKPAVEAAGVAAAEVTG